MLTATTRQPWNFTSALNLSPNYWFGYYFLGQVYTQQGKIEDAIAAQRKAAEISNGASWPLAEIARNYALAGKSADARQAVRDLLARSQHFHVSPYGIASHDTHLRYDSVLGGLPC